MSKPFSTPPSQYMPAAAPPRTAAVAQKKKKGEATDICPYVFDKIKLKDIKEFKAKVKKHNSKLTGSKVVDMWRKTTSEDILHSIEAGVVHCTDQGAEEEIVGLVLCCQRYKD